MSNALIDVHEELAQARIKGLHWKLGLILGFLTFFDGYDTFNPAYVIHYVVGPWHLPPGRAGLLVSSGLLGFLCGAALHGRIADYIGRRLALIGGLWITTIFTLLTAAYADSFNSFCALRVLTGLGLGVLLPLSTTYINELAPRRIANTFSLWGVALGWAVGGTAAGLVGVLLTPLYGWRALYWFGTLSIVLIPFLHFYLPESPKFLLLMGRDAELKKMLGKLRPEREVFYQQATILRQVESSNISAKGLLSPRYRRLSLSIWASSFLSLFCIFGLSGWIPSLMLQRGETFSSSFGFGALMQVMSFVGALACGYLVDKKGAARGYLAAWWFCGGLSVVALIFLESHIANLFFSAAAGFFIIGAQFVLNNFTATSYDTGVRATAVGMELGVGRLGAILGPFVGGALQQHYHGADVMLWTIGMAGAAAALAVLFAKPGASGAATCQHC